MRQIIIPFILFITLATVNPVRAQTGLKLGMTSAALTISEDEGRPFFGYEIDWLFWNRRTSFQLGISHEHRISEKLNLLAELVYTRRGLDEHTGFLFDDVDYLIKLDYLQIPLALKLRLPISRDSGIGLIILANLHTDAVHPGGRIFELVRYQVNQYR